MSIERIRDYHAQWIVAAEKRLINYDVAMMLIDTFELGIAEARESVIRREDISTMAEVEQIRSELSKIVNMRSGTLHNKFD
ncbi:hypothetical protein L1D34_22170 [Vibrio mediterranei]|uniref:hypothetical protein n=1 Tax=Vibrio mediterranei TaxID=689 RepID=UPI001EFD3BB5|nr:hypothetical protein [Vibrio mediterranei]MCG9627545.1 hypothetical protein [Vibrio mediterranei]